MARLEGEHPDQALEFVSLVLLPPWLQSLSYPSRRSVKKGFQRGLW